MAIDLVFKCGRRSRRSFKGSVASALLIATATTPLTARAIDYECRVDQAFSRDLVYVASEIKREDFVIVIKDRDPAEILRCHSWAPCDAYKVDRLEIDRNVGVKKFYVFVNQFDVQLFPDLKFIDNSGRGVVRFGRCVESEKPFVR